MDFNDLTLPANFDAFDWFILGLRIAFIALIYVFLYQIARVMIRELETFGRASMTESPASVIMPRPTSELEVLDPADSSWEPGTSFPLEHYSTIGRHEDNAIVLDDNFVSGTHAEVIFENGAWWLHDLGSTNGTLLNNQPVAQRTRISDGDIIVFGRVQVRAHA